MKKKKSRRKTFKNEIGITLIALVLTIVILIILATITINFAFGENGLIRSAESARDFYLNDTKYTEESISNVESYIDGIINGEEIDWEQAMADAKAPDSQDEERNEGVIGLGTDGKPVDMDLWEWNFDKVTDGYALNDAEVLQNTEYNSSGTNTETIRNAGYLGNIIDGKIESSIPVYISTDNGKTYQEVKSLYRTFESIKSLKECPEIPHTIINMMCTFEGCIELADAKVGEKVENMNWTFHSTKIDRIPEIHKSVNTLEGAFSQCNSLTEIEFIIPENVTSLKQTFENCDNLTKVNLIGGEKVKDISKTFAACDNLLEVQNIPKNVENMYQTFFKCTNLKLNGLVIPESVNYLQETFSECTNLSGTLIINANISDISQCGGIFHLAVQADKTLTVTGNCPLLDDIITNAKNDNIIKE